MPYPAARLRIPQTREYRPPSPPGIIHLNKRIRQRMITAITVFYLQCIKRLFLSIQIPCFNSGNLSGGKAWKSERGEIVCV